MSWLSKQFKSFKKHVIPKEVRKPFTAIGKAIPNEITGLYDDAMEGSKQIAEKLGYGSVTNEVKSNNTKRKEAAIAADFAAAEAEASRPTLMADTEEVERRRRRNSQRRRTQGRASTILGGDAETLG